MQLSVFALAVLAIGALVAVMLLAGSGPAQATTATLAARPRREASTSVTGATRGRGRF